MSDSDVPTPAPDGNVPPPPPPPPPPPSGGSAVTPPDVPMLADDPTLAGDPTIADDPMLPGDPLPGDPGDPTLVDIPVTPGSAAGAESTAMMAATGAMAAAGLPPTEPPEVMILDDEFAEEPVPWYQKPGPIAAVIIAVLAIGGLVAWLIFGGNDDDDDAASPTSTFLAFELTDVAGDPLDTGFVVEIVGPADAPKSFVWLRPDDTPAGEPAGESTGSDGRVAFEWEADDTVADPATWTSTISAQISVPAGWTPPGPVVDCVLQPLEGQQSVVAMTVELSSPDASADRLASITFPNYTAEPGDSVSCRLAAIAPVETTVVGTTVVDTTVVETTVVETTEATTTTTPPTTVPATTTPPTTVPPSTTTTSIDIIPPTPTQTLWDVIEASPSLSEFEQFAIQAGYQPALDDPTRTFTLFAPTNEAIDAFLNPDEGSPPSTDSTSTDSTTTIPAGTLNQILLAHANDTEAIILADLLNLPSIPVLCGDPQPIVNGTPPTVGGAGIYIQAPPASNGVLYLIDKVLTPINQTADNCAAP